LAVALDRLLKDGGGGAPFNYRNVTAKCRFSAKARSVAMLIAIRYNPLKYQGRISFISRYL
jgi:hypothetical protein